MMNIIIRLVIIIIIVFAGCINNLFSSLRLATGLLVREPDCRSVGNRPKFNSSLPECLHFLRNDSLMLTIRSFSIKALSRLAPVLKTIFYQCVTLYTCSQSFKTEPSE